MNIISCSIVPCRSPTSPRISVPLSVLAALAIPVGLPRPPPVTVLTCLMAWFLLLITVHPCPLLLVIFVLYWDPPSITIPKVSVSLKC